MCKKWHGYPPPTRGQALPMRFRGIGASAAAAWAGRPCHKKAASHIPSLVRGFNREAREANARNEADSGRSSDCKVASVESGKPSGESRGSSYFILHPSNFTLWRSRRDKRVKQSQFVPVRVTSRLVIGPFSAGAGEGEG